MNVLTFSQKHLFDQMHIDWIFCSKSVYRIIDCNYWQSILKFMYGKQGKLLKGIDNKTVRT
mgnify:CR=1 FL=1